MPTIDNSKDLRAHRFAVTINGEPREAMSASVTRATDGDSALVLGLVLSAESTQSRAGVSTITVTQLDREGVPRARFTFEWCQVVVYQASWSRYDPQCMVEQVTYSFSTMTVESLEPVRETPPRG